MFKTKQFGLLLIIGLVLFFSSHYLIADNHAKEADLTVQTEEVVNQAVVQQEHHAEENQEAHEEEHGADMSPLFFIIIALFIGTATRHFLRKGPLPFTITLIIIGVGLGILSRLGIFEQIMPFFDQSITWAGNIDPHLILFIFLPTLIFEASFNMDVHTFKKSFANSVILALPGIIIAMTMTALFIMVIVKSGLGLNTWTWTGAFLFGALINASDPVSVIALLKELGVSKKLSTLIDGESILNDGTAIVLFMVFLIPLTGQVAESSPFVGFLKVAIGGTLIGLIIGWILVNWIKHVYNDPMFEITTIIGGSYLTFFIAEKFFHVSGVLGLCALGIYFASIGRTKISPEVHHFLHEFWELAVFIANTLIFLIVGVVVAKRTIFTMNDFLILIILYVALMIVRFIMLWMLYPIMKRIGYGITPSELLVSWWGGLRGAVALALALVVASNPNINEEFRHQVLFYTAGIVMLTSLINATTIKRLILALGLKKYSEDKKRMIQNNLIYIKQSSEKALEKFKKDRFMSGANWDKVREFLPQIEELEELYNNASIAERRRRILQKEKSTYWELFEEGLAGGDAVQELSSTIDALLDFEGKVPLCERKDIEYLWKTPKILNKMQAVPLIGIWAQRRFFNKLAMSYDCARAFVHAQEEALNTLNSMAISSQDEGDGNQVDFETIESEINENKIQGLTFLRNLKEAFPEIYSAIETRQAVRLLLNHEQHTVEKLAKQHRIEADEAAIILSEVEEKIIKLMNTPPTLKKQIPIEMLKKISWLKDTDPRLFKKITSSLQPRVFTVGEDILKRRKFGLDLYIIVRGTAKVIINKEVVEIVGPGDVVGEMAVLTGMPRNATITAESPVTALRLPEQAITEIKSMSLQFENNLWVIAGQRMAENALIENENYKKMSLSKLRTWIKSGKVVVLSENEEYNLENSIAIVLNGDVFNPQDKNKVLEISCLIDSNSFKAKSIAWVYVIEKE
jgi:NhaP-type Na+/H+ or K+/H+ antiporter